MKNILPLLKKNNRLNLSLMLLVSTMLSVLLIAFRICYTGRVTFAFLVWNLFLAFIPFIISSASVMYMERIRSKLFLMLILFSWLLFFPNAPYIVTDFFHLRDRSNVLYWYDLGLLITC